MQIRSIKAFQNIIQVHSFDYWQNQFEITEDHDVLYDLSFSLGWNRQTFRREHQRIIGKGIATKYFRLEPFVNELKNSYDEFVQKSLLIETAIDNKLEIAYEIFIKNYKGLSTARIERFYKFEADKVGDRCGVCLEDVEVGRRMLRLDCQGQHVFCQDCIERWFVDHKTCPYCNHIFSNY